MDLYKLCNIVCLGVNLQLGISCLLSLTGTGIHTAGYLSITAKVKVAYSL